MSPWQALQGNSNKQKEYKAAEFTLKFKTLQVCWKHL